MAQRQRLLTGAGFAEFVLQLANLFLHARQRFIDQLHFMIQLSDKVGQLLFSISAARARSSFSLRRASSAFSCHSACWATACSIRRDSCFFSASARADVERTSTSVSSISDHQTHQLLRVLRFLQKGVDVGVHDVGKTRKIPIISILIVLVSGIHLWLSYKWRANFYLIDFKQGGCETCWALLQSPVNYTT